MDDDAIHAVLHYHEITKHHPDRFAPSPGYLDWENQPTPFRFYKGADRIFMEESPLTGPSYGDLFKRNSITAQQPNKKSLSDFFHDSMGLSAWKEHGGNRWALRVNPSSGNLHPTETYLISGPVTDLTESGGIFHYDPFQHALETRLAWTNTQWNELFATLPHGSFLVALTSIHWRESWKYGERAFRYCQHDIGHALAALAVSARIQGWSTRLLENTTDEEISILSGIHEQSGPEAETPGVLLAVFPAEIFPDSDAASSFHPSETVLEELQIASWQGVPNRLSRNQRDWSNIGMVSDAACKTTRPDTPFRTRPSYPTLSPPDEPPDLRPAAEIVRNRRSAVEMDAKTHMAKDAFFRLLTRLLPTDGHPVFDLHPWKPALHLLIFVHRVEGLLPGLYALIRHPGDRESVQACLGKDFSWRPLSDAPKDLALFLLDSGDFRDISREVSCRQDIAADGAFSLGMIANVREGIRRHGPWFYRRLFWEAGMIGQMLYLEAEAAGLRGTGIGCHFDDHLHLLLGMLDSELKSLYHFTVGGAIEDPRLRTYPAYFHRTP